MKNRKEGRPKNESSRPEPGRRAFLAGATATVAASGIAAATLGGTSGSRSSREKTDPGKLSYRETDHIRTFYARSRF